MLKNIWIAFFILAATNKVMANDSVYTSVAVKDCLTIESSELEEQAEIDYYYGQCPGLDGYQVYVQGGDIRYNLQMAYNGVAIRLPQLAAFHDLGSDKIEWRYKRTSKGVILKALIYRLSYQDYNVETEEFFETSKLYVVKLDGPTSCLAGEVAASNTMNLEARNIADDEDLTCK